MRSARPGSRPGVAALLPASEFVSSCSRSGSSVMTGSSVDMPAMSCTIWRPSATRTCACNCCGSCVRVACSASVSTIVRMFSERHAFGEKPLQRPHDRAERQQFRSEVFDELRRVLAECVEQLLHFFVTEQLMRVALHDVAQVRRDHRARVDDREAERLRVIARRRLDPHRFHADMPGRASRCPRARRTPCPD